MSGRVSSLAAGFVSLALTGLAAENNTATPPADNAPPVARQALKSLRFQPQANPLKAKSSKASAASPFVNPDKDVEAEGEADAPNSLSPYIVKELPHREFLAVSEAIAQYNRLRSRALIQSDLTSRVRMEMFGAPTEGRMAKANFPLLRFTW